MSDGKSLTEYAAWLDGEGAQLRAELKAVFGIDMPRHDPLLIEYYIMRRCQRDLISNAVTELPGRLAATVSKEALEPVTAAVNRAALTPIRWMKAALGVLTALCIVAAAGQTVIIMKSYEMYQEQQSQLNAAQELLNVAAADHAAAERAQAEKQLHAEQERAAAEAEKKAAAEKKRLAAVAAEKKRKDDEEAAAQRARAEREAAAQARYNECAMLQGNYARWGVRGEDFYGIYPDCRAILEGQR